VSAARVRFALALTPHGRVAVDPAPPDSELADEALAQALTAHLARDEADALLDLGARHPDAALSPSVAYFRDLARGFVAASAASPNAPDALPEVPSDLGARVEQAPPLRGREYLDESTLDALWQRLGVALRASLAKSEGEPGALETWLAARHPSWAVVGRVCFHLAENKRDPARPFAFLATYSSGLTADARVRHRPLGEALQQSADERDRDALLRLLLPVQRAAERSAFLKELVDSQAVFRPQAWTAAQAHRFLRDVPALEASGLVVRVPDWWRPSSPSRVTVQVSLGGAVPTKFGAADVVAFEVGLALDGEPIDETEWQRLRAAGDGLVSLRGKWVELDRARLDEVLATWKAAQRAARDGVSFHEAMRMLAGQERVARLGDEEAETHAWTRVVAGPWLRDVLARLRTPEAQRESLPLEALRATLRPYQREGVRWLAFANELGLGVCLADDMGLGKTVQVLALFVALAARRVPKRPHLLVAPASLLGTWEAEAARFAPTLRLHLAHTSGDGVALKDPEGPAAIAALAPGSVVVTTYGTLARTDWLRSLDWDTVVLDEAQAIKNPGAKQARAAKSVRARAKIALTGTPVENRAGDLFSLFDFLQPGLLGSAKEFRAVANDAARAGGPGWGPLRTLVAPYVLRRLKTDRRVAPDLPDKTELTAECGLTREQAALYQRVVDDLREILEEREGIARRGAVLAALLRLKQICNHPSHWLGDGGWEPARSGKLARLAELVEPIAERQEKALIFTQFREAVAPLARVLGAWFGHEGLVLDGETPIKQRKGIVDAFQRDDALPFLLLSLKAGGTGLTLTAATHVVHFDRWWNPAVEDQATDRAFRIGQKRAVMVHKMVCRGTVEERVDAMIRDKRGLARDLLAGGDEVRLTELDDEALMSTLALDLARARLDS
jgi:non-specific serine/threonine protein kinase